MAEHDVNIAVPLSHPRSFEDVLESLKAQGITVIQPLPAVGVIRVKVDDMGKLDAYRQEGLPVSEGRKDVGMAEWESPVPFAAPQAPAPGRQAPSRGFAPTGWKSPLSDL